MTKQSTLENKPLVQFTLAPLPREILALAEKFPELKKTLEEVGISTLSDVERLQTITFTLPGLTERAGVPVAQLPLQAKQQLPTEIVFAKTGGELIDVPAVLTVSDKGEVQQKISTISGKPLQLAVKPDQPVRSIKGYVVFRSRTPVGFQVPSFKLQDLLVSAFFARPVFAQTHDPADIETRLVLLEFEYTDADQDGIYTAEIEAPLVEGEYEIITVMNFAAGGEPRPAGREDLNKKEIRLIVVVDPEGYIYEQSGSKQVRIPGAIVSLYWWNAQSSQYQLWPAKDYQQENPQITDVTGRYSFLVPEGSYYLSVEAPGYLSYQGKVFQVKEGSGVHTNIALKTKTWWLKAIDWKIIVMIIFGVLLFYNFWRDKIRKHEQL